MDERYIERRIKIEQIFIPENKIADSKKIRVSPSGNFQFEFYRYSTGPKTWEYSRAIVTRISDSEVIADIKRNYGAFWHVWSEHPNGNEYLLCGEDYQGYSVINLTTGDYHVYFPEAGYKGAGFCWAFVYPSPDGLVLAVDGCYWACPYDLVFYDFREPDKLPYLEMARFDNLNDSDGWLDNDTFVLSREVEFRKSDGVAYEKLSEKEQDILDKDSSLASYRKETTHFKRPPFHE